MIGVQLYFKFRMYNTPMYFILICFFKIKQTSKLLKSITLDNKLKDLCIFSFCFEIYTYEKRCQKACLKKKKKKNFNVKKDIDNSEPT